MWGVTERLKVADSKSVGVVSDPWVRIPSPPPYMRILAGPYELVQQFSGLVFRGKEGDQCHGRAIVTQVQVAGCPPAPVAGCLRVQEVGCPPAPVADCLRVQMEIGLTAATYHREKFTWNICGLVATVLSATDSKRLGGSKQRGPFCDFNLQDKFGYSAFDGRGRPQCKFLPYFLALAMGARLFT